MLSVPRIPLPTVIVIAASGVKEIYTYTPQGDLICLPVNSTVLDFAFRVHTEIGQTCLGAMIRNKRVSSLSYFERRRYGTNCPCRSAYPF